MPSPKSSWSYASASTAAPTPSAVPTAAAPDGPWIASRRRSRRARAPPPSPRAPSGPASIRRPAIGVDRAAVAAQSTRPSRARARRPARGRGVARRRRRRHSPRAPRRGPAGSARAGSAPASATSSQPPRAADSRRCGSALAVDLAVVVAAPSTPTSPRRRCTRRRRPRTLPSTSTPTKTGASPSLHGRSGTMARRCRSSRRARPSVPPWTARPRSRSTK